MKVTSSRDEGSSAAALLDAIESERLRLGRLLHDVMSQDLAAASLAAEILAGKAEPASDMAAGLNQLAALLQASAEKIHALSGELQAADAVRDGLVHGLHELSANLRAHHHLLCDFTCEAALNVEESIALHVYQIVLELGIFASDHTGTRALKISAWTRRRMLNLLLEAIGDEGALERAVHGPHLQILKTRLAVLEASLHAKVRDGSLLTILIPVPRPEWSYRSFSLASISELGKRTMPRAR